MHIDHVREAAKLVRNLESVPSFEPWLEREKKQDRKSDEDGGARRCVDRLNDVGSPFRTGRDLQRQPDRQQNNNERTNNHSANKTAHDPVWGLEKRHASLCLLSNREQLLANLS